MYIYILALTGHPTIDVVLSRDNFDLVIDREFVLRLFAQQRVDRRWTTRSLWDEYQFLKDEHDEDRLGLYRRSFDELRAAPQKHDDQRWSREMVKN